MSETARAIDGFEGQNDQEGDQMWTETDLKKECQVSFVRAGTNETLVFEVVEYLGLLRMLNGKYGNGYNSHTWKVYFHRAAGVDYRTPLLGLLQMTDWIWNDFKRITDPQDLGHKGELVHLTFKDRLPKGITQVKIIDGSGA